MTNDGIERRHESRNQTADRLFLCLALKRALPAHTFVPSEGGGLAADSTELEPPFVVLAMGNAQKMLAQEGTWRMAGTAQVITHIGDTRVTARLVRAVYAALESLSPGSR